MLPSARCSPRLARFPPDLGFSLHETLVKGEGAAPPSGIPGASATSPSVARSWGLAPRVPHPGAGRGGICLLWAETMARAGGPRAQLLLCSQGEAPPGPCSTGRGASVTAAAPVLDRHLIRGLWMER